MTVYTINDKLAAIEEQIRRLDRRVEMEELRNKQIQVLFKMVLEKKECWRRRSGDKELRIRDIIEWMEAIVRKNLEPEQPLEINEPDDLISEIVKKIG